MFIPAQTIKHEAKEKQKGEMQIAEKEKEKNISLKTMNTVFSVEDFSDSSFFVDPASDAASGMGRSHSEWAFESFLEEFSGTGENNVIGPSSAPSQPSVSKAEEGDGNADVVEIKRPNHNLPPSDPSPTVPIDSNDYRAILKSKLELECAAVALSRRALAVNAEDSLSQAETQALQSDSKVQGSSKVQGQCETDVPPCGTLVGVTSQKKSGVQVKQATSGSSREDSDSDELEGDTEAADPTDAKRARRMRSNRESARRSRRRKQVHMNELEGQVGQLRVEHSTLLKHLTDMNHKYDEAAVDNRIMKADIETLRAKVKMAEETVKRLTGFNPVLSRPNLPSVDMPFVSSPLEASTIAPLPLQSISNQFFHQPAPRIVAPMHHQRMDSSFPGNTLVPPVVNTQTKGVKNVNRTSTLLHRPNLEGVQDQIGPGVSASGPMPGWEPGLSSHAADESHKQS